jgi:hypothetical protein
MVIYDMKKIANMAIDADLSFLVRDFLLQSFHLNLPGLHLPRYGRIAMQNSNAISK